MCACVTRAYHIPAPPPIHSYVAFNVRETSAMHFDSVWRNGGSGDPATDQMISVWISYVYCSFAHLVLILRIIANKQQIDFDRCHVFFYDRFWFIIP